MLAELLTKLQEMARGEAAVSFHEHPLIPGKGWLSKGQDLREIEIPPQERLHGIYTLSSLVELVASSEIAEAPEVFCSEHGAHAILGRSRREGALLPFTPSERWQALEGLARDGGAMSVPSAVKLLRFGLHGTGTEAVVQALRRVDFKRSSDGASVTEHGRESLGRSVEAAVQQADSIPEEFSVEVPVFSTPGTLAASTLAVRCGIYLDVLNETVQIRPLADELARAKHAAVQQIADTLETQLGDRGRSQVPVFIGTARLRPGDDH